MRGLVDVALYAAFCALGFVAGVAGRHQQEKDPPRLSQLLDVPTAPLSSVMRIDRNGAVLAAVDPNGNPVTIRVDDKGRVVARCED